jgi:hypothetical protein
MHQREKLKEERKGERKGSKDGDEGREEGSKGINQREELKKRKEGIEGRS